MKKFEFLSACQILATEHVMNPRPSERKIFDLCYDINTMFGNMRLAFEKTNNYGLYSAYMRFTDEDFDYKEATIFFQNISSNGKWNIHDKNPEYVLSLVKERLDNLYWIEDEENYNFVKDSETGKNEVIITLKEE